MRQIVGRRRTEASCHGHTLVDAAVDRARQAGCTLVELHSDLARARAFYERQGFHVTSNYFVRTLR
jgi:ribosomal protein S18 acetylase RimI-like enzyme